MWHSTREPICLISLRCNIPLHAIMRNKSRRLIKRAGTRHVTVSDSFKYHWEFTFLVTVQCFFIPHSHLFLIKSDRSFSRKWYLNKILYRNLFLIRLQRFFVTLDLNCSCLEALILYHTNIELEIQFERIVLS